MPADKAKGGSRLLDRDLDHTRIKVDLDPADFGMMAVMLELLAADAACPVDLYLPLYSRQTKKPRMELVAQAGEPFKADWLQRLARAEQTKVYTPLDQAEILNAYFDQHAGELLDRPNMTTRKRTKYIQELAAANLNALFGGDLSRQGMESTVTRAHEMVRQMTSDFQILSNVAEVLRSDYSVYSHSINVCMLAMGWGRFLGMPESRIRTLGVGGMLHDAGKAKLPRYLLSKPGELTSLEMAEMQRHPRLGYQMLQPISAVSYDVLMIVLHHHENADGTGYPAGLKRDRIPYLARLVRVVDAYDAMTSNRSFQQALPPVEAASTLLNQMAGQLGQDLVANFIRFLASPYMN